MSIYREDFVPFTREIQVKAISLTAKPWDLAGLMLEQGNHSKGLHNNLIYCLCNSIETFQFCSKICWLVEVKNFRYTYSLFKRNHCIETVITEYGIILLHQY